MVVDAGDQATAGLEEGGCRVDLRDVVDPPFEQRDRHVDGCEEQQQEDRGLHQRTGLDRAEAEGHAGCPAVAATWRQASASSCSDCSTPSWRRSACRPECTPRTWSRRPSRASARLRLLPAERRPGRRQRSGLSRKPQEIASPRRIDNMAVLGAPSRIESGEHIVRARRTAAGARVAMGLAGILLLAQSPRLVEHPALGVIGFATILLSAAVQLAAPRLSLLTLEESLSAGAGVLIIGFGNQHVDGRQPALARRRGQRGAGTRRPRPLDRPRGACCSACCCRSSATGSARAPNTAPSCCGTCRHCS